MADQRNISHETPGTHDQPASLTASSASGTYMDTPPDLRPDIQGSPQYPCTTQMVMEMRTLLRALPTKSDIEADTRLEEQHRQDIQGVKQDIQSLSSRLTTGESSAVEALTQRASALESLQDSRADRPTTSYGGNGRSQQAQQSKTQGLTRDNEIGRSSGIGSRDISESHWVSHLWTDRV